MFVNPQKWLKIGLVFLILFVCLTACKTEDRETGDSSILDFQDDTDRAIELIQEANRNLQSIKALYNTNNPKVEELKKALNAREIEKVQKIANELSLVIVDGYVFADNAKEKIDEAKNLSGINETLRNYLELKSESLELQIKAFDYRRDSAKLFRDQFGTEDTNQMELAKAKFTENEKKFAEYIAEAKKRSDEADKIWSDSKKKK